jgi:hypothetical protein
MSRRTPRSRLDTALLVVAGTLGTLPLSLFACAALARFLPVSPDARYALGFSLAIPLWILAMCLTFIARSGARALLTCLLLSGLLAAVVLGVPY